MCERSGVKRATVQNIRSYWKGRNNGGEEGERHELFNQLYNRCNCR